MKLRPVRKTRVLTEEVFSLAIDGNDIFVGCEFGKIGYVRADQLSRAVRLEYHDLSESGTPVESMATTGNGRVIAAVDTNLYLVENDGNVQSFEGGHTHQIMAVAAHPKLGWCASTGYDGTVRVWDVASRSRIKIFGGGMGYGCCLTILPGVRPPKLVVFTSRGEVRSYSSDPWSSNDPSDVDLGGGKFSLATEVVDRFISRKETNDRKIVGYKPASSDWITPVEHDATIVGICAIARSSLVVSCDKGGEVKIWDATDGTVKATCDLDDEITCIAISPDGKQLVCAGLAIHLIAVEE